MELPPWASALLEAARVGRLGLLDGAGRPRVLPVTFAVMEGVVWSAVDHKPKRVPGEELARVRWLRASPAVAFTVDRYSDDWSQLAWLQVLCSASVEPVDPAVLAALAERYPQYRDQPPAGPLLRLEPERAVYWRAA